MLFYTENEAGCQDLEYYKPVASFWSWFKSAWPPSSTVAFNSVFRSLTLVEPVVGATETVVVGVAAAGGVVVVAAGWV